MTSDKTPPLIRQERLLSEVSARLPVRLKAICELLVTGRPVFDLFCDHGLVGQIAYFSSSFSSVTFVDQVPALCRKIEKQLSLKLSTNKSPQTPVRILCKDVLKLDGQNIQTGLASNFVLAGVGCRTLRKAIHRFVCELNCPGRYILHSSLRYPDIPDIAAEYGITQLHERTVTDKKREHTIYWFDLP